MNQIELQGLPLWQFKILSKEPALRHFVSTRYPSDNGREFTLSFSSSPDKEEIRSNRKKLADAMSVSPDRLVFPSQVHRTRIVRITSETSKEDLMETDALISNEKEICIAVMSADCVPVLLYDKTHHAIAAIHAGWRGTVAMIVAKTLKEMNRIFGTTGPDLVAGIGPSVCQDSYEVGEEVIAEVNRSFGSQNGLLMAQPNNKAKLDLWNANKRQLLEFGMAESKIEISDLCTVKNNDHFFSARKGDSGRFAAGIMLC